MQSVEISIVIAVYITIKLCISFLNYFLVKLKSKFKFVIINGINITGIARIFGNSINIDATLTEPSNQFLAITAAPI